MSEPWHDKDQPDGDVFAPTVRSSLGTAAAVGMALSAVYQLLNTVVVTTMTMFVVVFGTVALVQYDGGLMSNEEEAATGMGIGVAVLLLSLLPLASALAACLSAFRLWNGGRRLSVIVASAVSMTGPLFMVAAVSLLVFVEPTVGAMASVLAVLAAVGCITTGVLAIVAVSKSTQASV